MHWRIIRSTVSLNCCRGMLRELCRNHVNCPSRAADATSIQRPAAGFLAELLHLNEVALFRAGSMRVFVLQHVHLINDGEEDVKLIGVYSTRERADHRGSAAISAGILRHPRRLLD